MWDWAPSRSEAYAIVPPFAFSGSMEHDVGRAAGAGERLPPAVGVAVSMYRMRARSRRSRRVRRSGRARNRVACELDAAIPLLGVVDADPRSQVASTPVRELPHHRKLPPDMPAAEVGHAVPAGYRSQREAGGARLAGVAVDGDPERPAVGGRRDADLARVPLVVARFGPECVTIGGASTLYTRRGSRCR